MIQKLTAAFLDLLDRTKEELLLVGLKSEIFENQVVTDISLPTAIFCDIEFIDVQFYTISFNTSSFYGCTFRGCSFNDCELFKTEFFNSTFENSVFNNSELIKTSFSECILENCSFLETLCTTAVFLECKLKELNFKTAINFERIDFSRSKIWELDKYVYLDKIDTNQSRRLFKVE